MKKLISILSLCLITISVTAQDLKTDSLTQMKIIAETKNQDAQSQYYTNQINVAIWPSVGSIIVAIIGLGSGAIIVFLNRQNEHLRHETELREGHEIATRNAVADLMKKTAEGFHNLTWILWIANKIEDKYNENLIKEHDMKMDKIYAEMAGAQVVLYSYNSALYESIEHIFIHLYDKDAEVGELSKDINDSQKRVNTIKKIADMWDEVYKYSLNIPKEVGKALASSLSNSNS